jgi:hypothetical protein
MALPNMAMIPSGYKPTKLYSVLPTPVVSDVEKVTNGDFSNGSTDWNIENTWTIAGGVANGNGANGSNQELIQSSILTAGKTYSITYEVKNYVSGVVRTQKPFGTDRSANGVYTEKLLSNASSVIFRGGSFNGSITNISVKEVSVSDADFTVERASSATRVNQQGLIETPEFIIGEDFIINGDFAADTNWNKGTGVTISGGSVNCVSSGSGQGITQGVNGKVQSGKTYKVTFTISNYVRGFVKSSFSGGGTLQGALHSENGTYTDYYTLIADNTSFNIKSTSTNGGFEGSIDNVSVVQVEKENIPRLDYTDGGCPVLLTEPQSTNFVTYSEDFTQGSWIHNSNLAITSNVTISPDGTQNADSLVYSGSGNRLGIDIAMTINTKYALSIYYKNNGGNDQIAFAGADTTGQTTVTITDEWARYTVVLTATATVTSNLRFMQSIANANLFAWGGQIEELDYATSYMPTYGTIASRAGETVTDAGNANTYNSEEGVLFLESASLVQDDTYRIISLCDGQDENRVSITYSNQTNEVSFSCRVNDANTFVFTKTLTDTTSFHKFAISYKLNEFKVYIDGVQENVDLSGSVFPANTLNELAFDRGINSLHFYGKTKQVQVFNTALSDFELKLLTSQDTNYNSYEAMRLALNYNIQ